MPGPFAPKQTAVDLKAELAVMEEEEAAEAQRKQEHEEKKKRLAELAEAKKAEEAIAAVAEAAWKAMASVKKAGKRRAEGPAEDKGASKKKKMQEDGEEDMDEVAQVACCKCVSFNLLYCLFTNDFHRCNNQQVECVRAAGVWGKTCRVCLKVKQKCDASWGKVAVENSGFSVFGPMGLALLERLVAGVEKVETELVKINKKLGAIDTVLCEGAIEEVDEIVNEGLNNEWYDVWRDEEMVKEVWGLEKENEVFLEFCREYKKGQEEDQGQVQVQEQEHGQEAE